ncbi:MAG: hypothetical protein ACLFNO_03030 [Parcubacteria group bacterium]
MLEDSNTNLDKAIVSTIAFFDVFSYPLSAFEVFKYLQKDSSYSQVVLVLEDLEARNIISFKNSFYCLKGKEDNFEIRQKRYNYSKDKMKIAKRWAKLFKLFTGLKLIALSNSIGSYNLREGGDIDLFIVSKRNRIWSTRFILALIGKIFNLRPKPEDEKDKLCLSFFVSEDNLNLQNYIKENDFYFFYWLVNLSSVYDYDNYLDKLLIQNLWLKKYLPNYFKILNIDNREIPEKEIVNKKRANNFIEKSLKNLQWKLFPQEIKDKANQGKEVLINDEVLKLHVLDRRDYFYQKYLERMKVYEDKF